MNLDICVVSEQTLHIYDFLQDGEEVEKLLARAEENARERGYTDTYKVMSYEAYRMAKREKYLSMPLNDIMDEQYYDMLDVLPPLRYGNNEGLQSFFLSEFYDETYTNQYASCHEKFYQKLVDITDKSTWIHNFISLDTGERL